MSPAVLLHAERITDVDDETSSVLFILDSLEPCLSALGGRVHAGPNLIASA